MTRKLSITLLIITFITSTSLLGQTKFSQYNQDLIDSSKLSILKTWETYRSSEEVCNKKIKVDKSLILFLNDFYSKDLSQEDIHKKLKKYWKGKFAYDTTKMGVYHKYETGIPSNGNLRVSISFATFENEIVFKRIYFSTDTYLEETSEGKIPLTSQDLNYLEQNCIPTIDFPMTFCNSCIFITCDTVYINKLKSLKETKYIFFLGEADKDLNVMTWFNNDTYYSDFVVNDISTLVKNRNYKIINDLLYSPNYILSVYAMEALTFLENSKQIENSDKTREKMEEIKNSQIKIKSQYSDVIRTGGTYKEVGITEREILSKFKRLQ